MLLHLGLVVQRKNHPCFQRWFGEFDEVCQRHGWNLMVTGSFRRFHRDELSQQVESSN